MDTIATLVAHAGAPGLIHLHHPHHPPSALHFDLGARCKVARLDAVEHHTQRLLYAGILSRLSSALRADLDERQPGDDGREVITWDAFARGLRTLWGQYVAGKRKANGRGKGKGKRKEGEEDEDEDEGQVVIVITKAERLKSVLGASWPALTRLPELVSFPIIVKADGRSEFPRQSCSAPRCRGTICGPSAATRRNRFTCISSHCVVMVGSMLLSF